MKKSNSTLNNKDYHPINGLRFLFLSLVFLFQTTVLAQELPEAQKKQVSNYLSALEAAENAQEYAKAAGASGKIGYIYWNNQLLDEAVTYLEKSISYNERVNNKNGIKSVRLQLGLVKIDKQDYTGALQEFTKGVAVAKELKSKEDILSGLINISAINQSLSNHQAAIDAGLEALDLAKELDNINLTKRSYGILYESYQSLGDSEKSIEYFDLYSTVDKFLKNEQVKQITTESNQKVAQIASAKEQSDAMLAISQLELNRVQDSLRLAQEISERQSLQLKLNQVTISEKEAQLENERIIRYGLTTVISLTLVFLIILYVQYRQKKQKNILLEEQKKEIEKQGENLAIKNEELMAVNKEKNLMMSMVAHDLKKPINDLTSLALILNDYRDNLPEDFNNLVSVLQQSSQGYREMVHKILDAGAIENRKLNIAEEKLAVTELLQKNADSQKLIADEKNIKIDRSDVPNEAFIKADRIYLAQAIENVLYNSMKYSPENSTVFLGAKEENDHYKLYVRDEGPGISPEDQKYLFETFRVLKNGDKESTGLGLSISKKYMEAMGGDIACESELGKGATFYFTVKKG